MPGWPRITTPRPCQAATARLCRRSSAKHARWPTPSLLYARELTSPDHLGMSERCQKRTYGFANTAVINTVNTRRTDSISFSKRIARVFLRERSARPTGFEGSADCAIDKFGHLVPGCLFGRPVYRGASAMSDSLEVIGSPFFLRDIQFMPIATPPKRKDAGSTQSVLPTETAPTVLQNTITTIACGT
jgi:hypothetical protein